jgi:hypothetical protein
MTATRAGALSRLTRAFPVLLCLVTGAAALPIISEVKVKTPVLKGYEFSVDMTLAWGPGPQPAKGACKRAHCEER